MALHVPAGLVWVHPGISQAVISPEGHEVEAFSKNSCGALGARGSCLCLRQGGQDGKGAERGGLWRGEKT